MPALKQIIRIEHVHKAYETPSGPLTPLAGTSASIAEGSFIMVMGPSGTGKSTLFRLLTRLEEPDQGTIFYRDKPLVDYEPTWLRREVHYVFQTPTLFHGTVGDNLAYPLSLKGRCPSDGELKSLLHRAALSSSYLDRPIERLSGGEKQRVNIARSLSLNPPVLMLDEPTAALDAESTVLIEHEIQSYHQAGNTILWITHSAEQAQRLGGTIWYLVNGQLRGEGIQP
ncbi:ATP-binding cassette domain-containing protein [Aneurinibacillus sp. Ricciae_BoGa-3]|uniref:ABC transporter ATP-binding protein n=1 Tax=Aneurinibacillus sp. Ricciae_BoGa-3 TaxID=3022697 RepID=UPI0023412062|nr:ATP-binding cassette domain-containing protein [Aneurinibacillus sp. Ricciae_BoGa-3]WCK53374.1 ATP-binding cassette domain-containing protein [Aneurinibacillus sp. Ricciae_BoGa-3]